MFIQSLRIPLSVCIREKKPHRLSLCSMGESRIAWVQSGSSMSYAEKGL
jgi:hypothetical protein